MRISDWSSDVCSSDLPHLEADNRAGHLAEQRRVHLGARPWRIGADARFMRRGQSVELCYQFGVIELTHYALHLDCDIIPRRHLIGFGVPTRADIGVGTLHDSKGDRSA